MKSNIVNAQRGKTKFPIFENECKKCYKDLIAGLKQVNWPARKKEVDNYIALLKMRCDAKLFTKESANVISIALKDFLFLYKTITGGDLKMTKLPGEKQLHDAYKKLNKEINRKVLEKTNGHK